MGPILELYTPDVLVAMYRESHACHSSDGLAYWARCNGLDAECLVAGFERQAKEGATR